MPAELVVIPSDADLADPSAWIHLPHQKRLVAVRIVAEVYEPEEDTPDVLYYELVGDLTGGEREITINNQYEAFDSARSLEVVAQSLVNEVGAGVVANQLGTAIWTQALSKAETKTALELETQTFVKTTAQRKETVRLPDVDGDRYELQAFKRMRREVRIQTISWLAIDKSARRQRILTSVNAADRGARRRFGKGTKTNETMPMAKAGDFVYYRPASNSPTVVTSFEGRQIIDPGKSWFEFDIDTSRRPELPYERTVSLAEHANRRTMRRYHPFETA